MGKIKINNEFEVLYLRYTVDERDEPVDIFIGADNEEVLRQIGDKYSTHYAIKKLDEYQSVEYNNSKYLGLYARIEGLFVDPCNPEIV